MTMEIPDKHGRQEVGVGTEKGKAEEERGEPQTISSQNTPKVRKRSRIWGY